MRRLVSVAAFLSIFAFVPLAAQDDDPNVYRVTSIEVIDQEYYTYVQEVLYPVWDEFVNMGLFVSYHGLDQFSGAGEVTILSIMEFPDWDTANELGAAYDEASQAAHGTTWAEAAGEYFPLSELRKIIRVEFYGSIKP